MRGPKPQLPSLLLWKTNGETFGAVRRSYMSKWARWVRAIGVITAKMTSFILKQPWEAREILSNREINWKELQRPVTMVTGRPKPRMNWGLKNSINGKKSLWEETKDKLNLWQSAVKWLAKLKKKIINQSINHQSIKKEKKAVFQEEDALDKRQLGEGFWAQQSPIAEEAASVCV